MMKIDKLEPDACTDEHRSAFIELLSEPKMKLKAKVSLLNSILIFTHVEKLVVQPVHNRHVFHTNF